MGSRVGAGHLVTITELTSLDRHHDGGEQSGERLDGRRENKRFDLLWHLSMDTERTGVFGLARHIFCFYFVALKNQVQIPNPLTWHLLLTSPLHY